uniref:SEFIR domain-containing protein n=1 Tax=Heterorhabditis bacteriophora TaxID=37862 RepID=A0A1I7WIY7_HETBA
MVVGSAAFFLYHHCQPPPDLRDVELVECHSVLILYCDDCEEHSRVIFELGQVLHQCAKAVVLLDQNELNIPGVRPSRWLIDSMCRANRVIIVISPCSQMVLDGKVLQQRRPFPDLFAAAVNMIIRECTAKIVNSRFAICRLPYSPKTPDQLSILGIQEFSVPSNMPQLTAFIHQIDQSSHVQHSFDPQLLESFLHAVNEMENVMKTNADWMQHRFVEEVGNKYDLDGVVKFCDIPNRVPTLLDTKEKRAKAAEEFGLLPPDENEVGLACLNLVFIVKKYV